MRTKVLGEGESRTIALELMLTESPSPLRRVHDAASGLALIKIDA